MIVCTHLANLTSINPSRPSDAAIDAAASTPRHRLIDRGAERHFLGRCCGRNRLGRTSASPWRASGWPSNTCGMMRFSCCWSGASALRRSGDADARLNEVDDGGERRQAIPPAPIGESAPMSSEDDEPFGAELISEMLRSRIEDARAQYNAIINRLWAGCGGGLIAVVTVARKPTDTFFWLSAGSFGLGVLLLAIGALWTLIYARKVIRHLEEIDGFLEMRTDYAERPSAGVGLKLLHPQTWTAVVAAGLLVLGVIFAGILVARH
jgi:hypothetical protein